MKFLKSACIEPMYSEIPFLDRFQAAKDDGFEFVEFWSWTDKDLDAVKAAAEAAGIGISGFNGDAELSLIDPAQKTDYLEFLKKGDSDYPIELLKIAGVDMSQKSPIEKAVSVFEGLLDEMEEALSREI